MKKKLLLILALFCATNTICHANNSRDVSIIVFKQPAYNAQEESIFNIYPLPLIHKTNEYIYNHQANMQDIISENDIIKTLLEKKHETLLSKIQNKEYTILFSGFKEITFDKSVTIGFSNNDCLSTALINQDDPFSISSYLARQYLHMGDNDTVIGVINLSIDNSKNIDTSIHTSILIKDDELKEVVNISRRKIKQDQMVYFDHPYFGVIVMITESEKIEDESIEHSLNENATHDSLN